MPFGVKGSNSFTSCLPGFSIGILVSMRISGASVEQRVLVWKAADEVPGCMKCNWWSPGLWCSRWSSEMPAQWWVGLAGTTSCTSFSAGDIYSGITAVAGWVKGVTLACMKASHIYQSQMWACLSLQLERGQTHSLGWDLSEACYQSHLNLTRPPALPAAI